MKNEIYYLYTKSSVSYKFPMFHAKQTITYLQCKIIQRCVYIIIHHCGFLTCNAISIYNKLIIKYNK